MLDFGLAKAVESSQAAVDPAHGVDVELSASSGGSTTAHCIRAPRLTRINGGPPSGCHLAHESGDDGPASQSRPARVVTG